MTRGRTPFHRLRLYVEPDDDSLRHLLEFGAYRLLRACNDLRQRSIRRDPRERDVDRCQRAVVPGESDQGLEPKAFLEVCGNGLGVREGALHRVDPIAARGYRGQRNDRGGYRSLKSPASGEAPPSRQRCDLPVLCVSLEGNTRENSSNLLARRTDQPAAQMSNRWLSALAPLR